MQPFPEFNASPETLPATNSEFRPAEMHWPENQVLLPERLGSQSEVKKVVVVPLGPAGGGAGTDAEAEPAGVDTGVLVLTAGAETGAETAADAVGATPPPKVAQVLKSAVEVEKRLN